MTTSAPFPEQTLSRIRRSGVVAVLVLEEAHHAARVAEALLAGGVDAIELTLRTPASLDALAAITAAVPDMLAGVGTVLTIEQLDQVVDLGVAFGVAPGLNPAVVEHAQRRGLPFAPGVMTPSDIEAALALGCRQLKFFPAESSGGLPQLVSMKAPYRHLGLGFVPLGGLNLGNMADYLADPDVLAIGGSWLASAALIRDQAWDTITANAVAARRVVESARAKDVA
jgi:2-dehydro-3-deoxyphosphogluconate aldolase/(4S)-4-hydroxy-2-oxoglutarate aldolase